MNSECFDLILQFKERLYRACESNDVDEVKEILKNIVPIYDEIKSFSCYSTMENFAFINAIVKSFTQACAFGHLSTVKLFVESDDLEKVKKNNPFSEQRLGYYNNEALVAATQSGYIEIIKYLCDTRLKNHLSFYLEAANLLKIACKEGQLNVVKYLFNDPVVSPIIKSLFNKEDFCQSLEKACDNGHLEIVKYLLTSNDLEYKANVHIDNDAPFSMATAPGSEHILEYLIFDYSIEITKNIQEIAEKKPFVKNLIEMRELNKDLNKNFQANNLKQKKVKI